GVLVEHVRDDTGLCAKHWVERGALADLDARAFDHLDWSRRLRRVERRDRQVRVLRCRPCFEAQQQAARSTELACHVEILRRANRDAGKTPGQLKLPRLVAAPR